MGDAGAVFFASVLKSLRQVLEGQIQDVPACMLPQPTALAPDAVIAAETRERMREVVRVTVAQLAERLNSMLLSLANASTTTEATAIAKVIFSAERVMGEETAAPTRKQRIVSVQSQESLARGISPARGSNRTSSQPTSEALRARVMAVAQTSARAMHCRLMCLYRLERDSAPQGRERAIKLLAEIKVAAPAVFGVSASLLDVIKRLRALLVELDEASNAATADSENAASQQQRTAELTRQLRDCKRIVDRSVGTEHLPADTHSLAVQSRDHCVQKLNEFESLIASDTPPLSFVVAAAVARTFAAVDGFLTSEAEVTVRREAAQAGG
jgi:hypothetical protein